MELAVSRLHFPVTTLGPGRRVGVWFQGCNIRCPGCVSADTWGFEKGQTTVAKTLEVITAWLPQADGLTISGGEPFDQADALVALLAGLPLRPDQDILVYSGYPVEALSNTLDRCEGRIDALISDPFIADAPQTLRLRGSDNQRLHLLTERGRRLFSSYQTTAGTADRRLDVMFDDDGTVWLAGVPRQHDMVRLRHLLADEGHVVATSDATHSSR